MVDSGLVGVSTLVEDVGVVCERGLIGVTGVRRLMEGAGLVVLSGVNVCLAGV